MIIGLALAVVLFSFFGWLYYNCCLADTLIGYTGADTALYLHLNWPQQKNSPALGHVYDQLAENLGLKDFNWRWIRREAAIVCRNDLEQSCVLLARTYSEEPLIKFLNAKGLPYRQLKKNYLAISANQGELNQLTNRKSRLTNEIKNNFSLFDAFDLYLAKRPEPPDIYRDIFLFPLLTDGPLFLKGKIQKAKILISLAGNNKKIPSSAKQKIINYLDQLDDFDLIAGFSDPNDLLRQWENSLAKISPADYQLWRQDQAFLNRAYNIASSSALNASNTNDFYLLLDKKNGRLEKNWLLANDFALLLPLKNTATDQVSTELESSLKAAFARSQPRAVSKQLSDGSKITEYLPQSANLDFASRQDFRVLAAKNNNLILAYKLTGGRAVISNNLRLLEGIKIKPLSTPFLKIKTSLLPDSPLTFYLRNFKQLTIFGDQIIAD